MLKMRATSLQLQWCDRWRSTKKFDLLLLFFLKKFDLFFISVELRTQYKCLWHWQRALVATYFAPCQLLVWCHVQCTYYFFVVGVFLKIINFILLNLRLFISSEKYKNALKEEKWKNNAFCERKMRTRGRIKRTYTMLG